MYVASAQDIQAHLLTAFRTWIGLFKAGRSKRLGRLIRCQVI